MVDRQTAMMDNSVMLMNFEETEFNKIGNVIGDLQMQCQLMVVP